MLQGTFNMLILRTLFLGATRAASGERGGSLCPRLSTQRSGARPALRPKVRFEIVSIRVEEAIRVGLCLELERRCILKAGKILVIAAGYAAGSISFAQTTRPAFEVSSIRPSKTNESWFWNVTPGGRLVCCNCTLKRLAVFAYRVQEYQVVGGPAWVSKDQFDIEAKPHATSNATDEKSRRMLQALLEARFHLRIRMETRNGPVYALLVVKNGPPRSVDQSPPAETGPPPDPNGPMLRGAMRTTAGNVSGKAIPIPLLARFLGQTVGRPVIDKTGLTGRYDIDVRWTPESAPLDVPAGAPLPEVDGPSLFTALQEQVGLRLESTTGPVQQLVIEDVERPSEN
jgi:uncharacterized protein (TIGR03435 family)